MFFLLSDSFFPFRQPASQDGVWKRTRDEAELVCCLKCFRIFTFTFNLSVSVYSCGTAATLHDMGRRRGRIHGVDGAHAHAQFRLSRPVVEEGKECEVSLFLF